MDGRVLEVVDGRLGLVRSDRLEQPCVLVQQAGDDSLWLAVRGRTTLLRFPSDEAWSERGLPHSSEAQVLEAFAGGVLCALPGALLQWELSGDVARSQGGFDGLVSVSPVAGGLQRATSCRP